MHKSNIIFYTTPNGHVSVQVQYKDGRFWLTQKRMGELFGVDVRTVALGLRIIYHTLNNIAHIFLLVIFK